MGPKKQKNAKWAIVLNAIFCKMAPASSLARARSNLPRLLRAVAIHHVTLQLVTKCMGHKKKFTEICKFVHIYVR